MLCKSCGKKVDINKKFCTNCGWKIEVPVTKEEFKKVIPKETIKEVKPISKDELNQKKEALLKNEFDDFKSGIKKQSKKNKSFINNFFSNLKRQSLTSEVDKNKLVENKGKGFNKPLFVFLGLASLGGLLGIAQYVSNERLYTYVEPDPIAQYLEEDGNCCSEKLSSGISIDEKLSVLNEIIYRNPKDSEALLQRANTNEIDGNYLARCIDLSKATILGNGQAKSKFYEELYSNDNPYDDWKRVWKGCHIEKSSKYLVSKFNDWEWKKFGIYSVYMQSVSLDLDHFEKYQDLVYDAYVRKNGTILDYTYSFDCSSRKKYDWITEEWKKPTSSYEESMIDAMCFSRGADPRITNSLEKIGWKKVYKLGWVDVNSWESFKDDGMNYYETVFYDEPKLYMSKLAVACNPIGISFKSGGEWSEPRSPIGQERNLVIQKCNQALSSSSDNIWSIEDVYSLVGGETKYNKLMEWVSSNLSWQEIHEFNETIDSDDFNLIKSSVLKLKEQRDNS